MSFYQVYEKGWMQTWQKINGWMQTPKARFQEIENSQNFMISTKYDTLVKNHDNLIEKKSQVATTETNVKTAEKKINDNFDSIARNEDHFYSMDSLRSMAVLSSWAHERRSREIRARSAQEGAAKPREK